MAPATSPTMNRIDVAEIQLFDVNDQLVPYTAVLSGPTDISFNDPTLLYDGVRSNNIWPTGYSVGDLLIRISPATDTAVRAKVYCFRPRYCPGWSVRVGSRSDVIVATLGDESQPTGPSLAECLAQEFDLPTPGYLATPSPPVVGSTPAPPPYPVTESGPGIACSADENDLRWLPTGTRAAVALCEPVAHKCVTCEQDHYTTDSAFDRDGHGVETGATECIPCPEGMVNALGDGQCEGCGAGSYTASGVSEG
jgi:hypothetical protein